MRILILDDSDVRHESFAKEFAGHDVQHVHTVDEACKALLSSDHPFDLVQLDHDLNDFSYKSTAAGMYGDVELTGVDVARLIARELPVNLRPARVIVHSWNPPGARLMVDLLREANITTSYVPFRSVLNEDTSDLVASFEQEQPL